MGSGGLGDSRGPALKKLWYWSGTAALEGWHGSVEPRKHWTGAAMHMLAVEVRRTHQGSHGPTHAHRAGGLQLLQSASRSFKDIAYCSRFRRLQACTVSGVSNNMGEMLTLCSSLQTGTCGTVARFSPPRRLLPLPSPSSRCSSVERSTSSATGCPFAARRRPAAWSTGLEAGAWSNMYSCGAIPLWKLEPGRTQGKNQFCCSLVSFKH